MIVRMLMTRAADRDPGHGLRYTIAVRGPPITRIKLSRRRRSTTRYGLIQVFPRLLTSVDVATAIFEYYAFAP